MKQRGYGLTGGPSRNLPGGTEEHHDKPHARTKYTFRRNLRSLFQSFAANFSAVILTERCVIIFIVFSSVTGIWEFSRSKMMSILCFVTTRSTCPTRNRDAQRLRRSQAYWLWKRNAAPGCGIRCDLDLCYYCGPPPKKIRYNANPCEWNQTQGTAPQTRVFDSQIKGNSNLATAPNALKIACYRTLFRETGAKKNSRYVPLKACANIPIALSTASCVGKTQGFYVRHVIGILFVDVSSGPRDIAGHLDDKDVTYEMTRSTLVRQEQ